MARAGANLDAVAGFHASLGVNTPAPAPGTVKAKILVLNGADDPFVKREQYDALKRDFDAAKADYQVIEYPGAVHAFTNPEATELESAPASFGLSAVLASPYMSAMKAV